VPASKQWAIRKNANHRRFTRSAQTFDELEPSPQERNNVRRAGSLGNEVQRLGPKAGGGVGRGLGGPSLSRAQQDLANYAGPRSSVPLKPHCSRNWPCLVAPPFHSACPRCSAGRYAEVFRFKVSDPRASTRPPRMESGVWSRLLPRFGVVCSSSLRSGNWSARRSFSYRPMTP
jgi:hypothetical protein